MHIQYVYYDNDRKRSAKCCTEVPQFLFILLVKLVSVFKVKERLSHG